MPVVIEQFEHVASPESETRGPGGAAPSGGSGSVSDQAIRAQALAAIHREAARQARLWAD